MSATATRPASDLDQRRLGIAMGALILAVALLVTATVGRQLTTQAPAVPAAVPAAVAHDHGWVVSSGAEKGFVYTGIPYTPTRETLPLNPGEIIVGNMGSDGLSGSFKAPRERFAQ